LRHLQRGAARGHVGLGLLLRGHGDDEFLLADGVGLQQRLVAFGLCRRLREVRLGSRQRGLRTGRSGAVRCRVDLEQRLAGFHVAALDEQALLHDAGGARTHLRHARRFKPAGQLGGQADRARRGDHDAHFGRRRGATRRTAGRSRRVARFGVAGGEQQRGGQHQSGGAAGPQNGGAGQDVSQR